MENKDHDILIRLETMVGGQGRELRELHSSMKVKADAADLADLGRRFENMKEELKKDFKETIENAFQPRLDEHTDKLDAHQITLNEHGNSIRDLENARSKFMGVIIAAGVVIQGLLWVADKFYPNK